MTPVIRARLCVLAATALFSTGGAGVKLCSLSPSQLVSLRCGIGGLLLLLLLRPNWREVDWRAWLPGIALGGTLTLFVFSSRLTTAASAILLQATAPLWVLLLGPWLLGEHSRRSDWAVMAAMAVGLIMVCLGAAPAQASAPHPLQGNLLAVVSGLTWGLTTIGLRRALRSGDGAEGAVVIIGNFVAVGISLPMALPFGPIQPADWAVVGFLGVFQIAVPYLFFFIGLRHLRAFEGVLLMLLEPVLSAIWTALIHGERPGWWPVAGGAIILAATVWNATRPATETAPAALAAARR